jgi:lysine-N-methylase
MSTRFVFASGQHFACRDCPARCCRLPATIRLSADEIGRYREEQWIRERLGAEGMRWLEQGIVPMYERAGQLDCMFLDEDELCSMHKRFGHDSLPQTCQAFPFGFVRNERQEVVVDLSRLCPSIRDNRGELVDLRLVKAKLAQRGGAQRMAKAMSTVERRILTQAQYLQVAGKLPERLDGSVPPAQTVAELYDFVRAVEVELAAGPEKPTDDAVRAALARRQEAPAAPLVAARRTPFAARMLFAYCLGNLCYPARVILPHRTRRAPLQSVGAFGTKLKWLVERGTVDLLYVPRPVRLQHVARVRRFLGEPEGEIVTDYLRLVMERRQIFAEPRYLLGVVLDLGLGALVISRFARCRAAAEGRSRVEKADVREGIAVAELVLLNNASQREEGRMLRNLRRTLLGSREAFRRLLGTEA